MRRQPTDNSFDLFLDAICNTFGGIVFLAILLAILIQTRAIVKSPEATAEESPVSAAQLRELVSRLDAAEAELATITAAIGSLPKAKGSSDNLDFHELLKKYESQKQQLNDAVLAQIEKTKSMGKQLLENQEVQQENSQLPIDLAAAQAKAAENKSKMSQLVAKRETTYRLPRDRSTNASSVLALVLQSRFYLARQPFDSPGEFSEHVHTSRRGTGTVVSPVKGKGFSLDHPAIEAIVSQAKSRGHIVTLAVWPDSFKDFPALKKLLVAKDVPYQLWPQQTGQQLTIYFGANRSRVQ